MDLFGIRLRRTKGPLTWVAVVGLVCWLFGGSAARGVDPKPTRPMTEVELEKSIQRGIRFLLQDQNKDGSWGTAQRTKDLNIFAPVPGSHQAFRSAVTALCVAALIETGAVDRDADAALAVDRGGDWLLQNLPNLRRADAMAIYNVWSHGYGIHALVDMLRRAAQDPQRAEEIKECLATQIDLLRRYESVDGGWGYYDFKVGAKRPSSDSTSFVSATVLIAFHEAREMGIEIPQDLSSRAIATLHRQRKRDFSYSYEEDLKMRPMMPVNRPGGSLGRSQACNLALRLWGDKTITDTVLTDWLDRLVTRNGWLSIGRKRPIPHESWFQVAGYFFYYGHYYAALCLGQLDAANAARYRGDLAAILLPLQEKDGSWWDFPLYNYHQQYGTAFALMSLHRCRKPSP